MYKIVLLVAIFTTISSYAKIPPAPHLPVASYILMDADTGMILAEQDANKRVLPASTTKMMTAYLVNEALEEGEINEYDLIPISETAASVEGSRIYLKAGSNVSVDDLLDALIIVSANDASIALAEHLAGSEKKFSVLMNQQAEKLGMKNTNFVNSNGLPANNHYSSARDLALLGKALIQDYPQHYSRHSIPSYTYNTFRKENSNKLLKQAIGVDGIKTGYTRAAKYCLVSSAKREDMRLIAVVMGAKTIETRNQLVADLLDYGFRYYETDKVLVAGESIETLPVRRGAKKQVNVGLNDDLYITIPRGDYEKIEATINVPEVIMAPITENQIIGDIQLKLDGKIIAERAIYSLEEVKEGSWWQKSLELWNEYWETKEK